MHLSKLKFVLLFLPLFFGFFLYAPLPAEAQTTSACTVLVNGELNRSTCTSNQIIQYDNCLASNARDTNFCRQSLGLQTVTDSAGNVIPQPANTQFDGAAEAKTDFGCTLGNSTGVNGGKAFATCITSIVYYIGPGLASNVAYIGAYFFSYAVALSLNGIAYALDFLATGWEMVRDLANMGFILILVYIAYLVMLRAETSGTVRMLAWVIVMALLINFSFFFTRIVIDAGNILAVQFYNAIPAGTYETTAGSQPATFGANNVKDLSSSIMNALKLQTLWGQQSFDLAYKAAGDSVTGALIVVSVVYLATAAMFWILFFVFLQVGIKFILRIVILWFVIVAAPLAFAAKAMPKDSFKKFYNQWQDALIKFSFYPAVFLFMLLVIVRFMDEMFRSSGSTNLIGSMFNFSSTGTAGEYAQSIGFASAIANVSIRMGFIVAMFYIALKVSDWIIEEGNSLATRAISGAGRATLTSASLAGKIGIGGVIGGSVARSPTLANGNAFQRSAWQVGRFLNNRTYDARNVPGVKKTLGALAGDVVTGRKGDMGVGSKTTARDLEKKVGTFGTWMREGSEASRKDRKEINDQVAMVKFKTDTRRIKQTTEYDKIDKEKEKIEKSIKRRDELQTKLNTTSLDREETAEHNRLVSANLDSTYINLGDKKRDIEQKEGKSWDALKAEHATLTKRLESVGSSQITSLKGSDIEGIIKQVSESQLKAIKESGKYTAQAIEEIERKWHEEHKKAPLAESKKQLEELGKIRDLLKEKYGMVNIATEMPKLHEHTRSGNLVTVNLKAVEDIKKEIIDRKEKAEDARRDTSLTQAERTAAGQHERELRKAESQIDKLIDKLKDVPEKIGSSIPPASFEYKAER